MLILLVMQSLENSIQLKVKHRWPGGGIALTTEQDPEHPNPDQITGAYAAARWLAQRIGGRPGASVPESVLGIPITAHILGGAVIGADREHGVIDSSQHVFGYRQMLVCDGSAIPANIGVNPSLTITALAERAMSFIPDRPENPEFD